MIKYSNGVKEVIHHTDSETANTRTTNTNISPAPIKVSEDRKVDSKASTGFIFSILSLASLILAIVASVPAFVIFYLPFAIVGIIFSSTALRKMHKSPNPIRGKSYALAGLILGIIEVAIPLLLFIIILSVLSSSSGMG